MKTKKTPDDPISTDSGTGTEDTHLVDEVLQQRGVHTLNPEGLEISEQLKAMRAEVDRIGESIGLLGEGVKTVLQQMPTMLEEEFSRRVQRNPLTAILGTALLSFGLTLLLTGENRAQSQRIW